MGSRLATSLARRHLLREVTACAVEVYPRDEFTRRTPISKRVSPLRGTQRKAAPVGAAVLDRKERAESVYGASACMRTPCNVPVNGPVVTFAGLMIVILSVPWNVFPDLSSVIEALKWILY
jgi:hypothetical protein